MPTETTDATIWLTATAILGLLVLSAFLSGSETALIASSRTKLKALADKGVQGAATALAVTEDRERLIGALLLGNTVANVLAASLAAVLLARSQFDTAMVLSALAIAGLILTFGEVLPKAIANTYPEPVATKVAPIVRVIVAVLSPIMSAVTAIVRAILRMSGLRADADSAMLALREDIAGAIAFGHSEGAVEKEDRDRLLGALDLSHRTVDEIMRHRRQIEMIDATLPPGEIITRVLASSHTRLPIYRDSDENILGVIHAKDLLREVDRLVRGEDGSVAGIENLDIVKVAMKPYFIPDTTSLDEQMREFLSRRTHFALVVDEYGALQGLITLEDILEEIVGDITDEFDVVHKDAGLSLAEDGGYLVEGAMTIRDLNRATDWRLPDDEANTIAGLVIHEAQMIPNEGQVFSFHGFRFEVAARRENRITRLNVRRL
jgi:Mg2+/Co2+ transporter CorB